MRVELIGLREVQVKLDRMPPTIRAQVRAFVSERVIVLRDSVRANIRAMFQQPKGFGFLDFTAKTSIERGMVSDVTESDAGITGRVAIEGVPWARIQEEGGDTSPHDIYPVNGNALAFQMKAGGYSTGIGSDWKMRFSGGAMQTNMVVVRHVRHPGSRIPEHPYMRLALAREKPFFEGGIRAIVAGAIGE